MANTKELKCDLCGGTFNRQSSLNRHRKHHCKGLGALQNRAERQYECQTCSKLFSRKEYLLRHQRLHTGEGNKECWLCARPFRPDYLPNQIISCLQNAQRIYRRLNRDAESGRSLQSALDTSGTTFSEQSGLMVQMTQLLEAKGDDNTYCDSTRSVDKPVRMVASERSFEVLAKLGSLYPLCQALRLDDSTLFAEMFEKILGLGLNATNINALCEAMSGDPLVVWAIFSDAVKTLSWLLENFPILKADSSNGQALCIACRTGRSKCVEVLLSAGADVDSADEGVTALCFAAEWGIVDVARLLLDAGASMEGSKHPRISSPLAIACEGSHLQVVKLLLERGAQVNSESDVYRPLDYALMSGSAELVRCILEAGARPELVNKNSVVELQRRRKEKPNADHKLDSRELDELYEYYFENVEETLRFDSTFELHVSARDQGREGVTVMDVDAYWIQHSTQSLLTELANKGAVKYIDHLVDAGIDANEHDGSEWTPLHAASNNAHFDAAYTLISGGAELDPVHPRLGTPLSRAAGRGQNEMVKLLLAVGADPNEPSNVSSGLTPLQGACYSPFPSRAEGIVQDLIAAGANVNLGNPPPLAIVENRSLPSIEDMLKRAGARLSCLPETQTQDVTAPAAAPPAWEWPSAYVESFNLPPISMI